MMKFNTILMLLIAAGFFVVSPVFAAQNQPNDPNESAAANSDQQMNHSQSSMMFNDVHVRDLIGKKIVNQKGKFIGTVSDVVLGKDGKADFVVLARGGIFSKDKYTPVPYKLFISNAINLNNLRKDRNVRTQLSKALIDKAPTFSTRHFSVDNSRGRICGYFGPQQCSKMGEQGPGAS